LKISVASYGHTTPLKNGSVPIEGIEPQWVEVNPQIAAFRRMVRDVEFDACEVACTTYFVARAYGRPFKALPLFLMRNFHHGGIVYREDSGIKGPKDLEGKKVGVRAYTVTTGAWTRGILAAEYGLDVSKVTWVVDDEEHVQELKLPSNVVHVPEGKTLVSMMASGEIQAGFTANAGIGREGPPKEGWAAGAEAKPQVYPDLIPNVKPLEEAWFKRTGVYPMHGVLVVKDEVLENHPWIVKSLCKAFTEAKNRYVAQLRAGKADSAHDERYAGYLKLMDDPLPMGIQPNLPTINMLIDIATKQGLIPRRMSVDELFVDPEKAA
jgi:4,5-dihydroxyphthalate decarboxylase